jgi:hypothetical protein
MSLNAFYGNIEPRTIGCLCFLRGLGILPKGFKLVSEREMALYFATLNRMVLE